MKTKTAFLLTLVVMLTAQINSLAQITFSKVTAGAIVGDTGQFVRPAWGDFDGDGFLDLVVCNWGGRTNVYYHNNGNGTFAKLTQGDPVQDAGYHVSPGIGDFDNDGFLDLVVSSGFGSPTGDRSQFYHNNGDGTFSRIGGGGLTNAVSYFGVNACADYDNDGFLDLFVSDGNGRNLLWHNNGDGTFTEAQGPPGTGTAGWGALWSDYDNDGFMDLFVTVQGINIHNYLYHNNRDGTFTRILTNAIATDLWVGGSEIGTWGDYDNDGLQDLFVTGDDGSPNRLYHNEGGGKFTKITDTTAAPMLIRPDGSDSLACAWGDYDNDGHLDLFITTYNGPDALYHNNGDGTFTQVLSDYFNDINSEFSLGGWVDYDNDGFLDLFFARNNGDVPSVSNLLYHNDGNTNNWLEVRLVGTASNRSAIGAKVHVLGTIAGKPTWQMREINGGGGRNVQPLVAHFGLGDATNADTMRIEWPSGIVQTLTNVASRQSITLVEHQATVNPPRPPTLAIAPPGANGLVNLTVTGDPGLLYVIEATTNLLNWTWMGVRSNATGSVQFLDTAATNHPARYYRASIP